MSPTHWHFQHSSKQSISAAKCIDWIHYFPSQWMATYCVFCLLHAAFSNRGWPCDKKTCNQIKSNVIKNTHGTTTTLGRKSCLSDVQHVYVTHKCVKSQSYFMVDILYSVTDKYNQFKRLLKGMNLWTKCCGGIYSAVNYTECSIDIHLMSLRYIFLILFKTKNNLNKKAPLMSQNTWSS